MLKSPHELNFAGCVLRCSRSSVLCLRHWSKPERRVATWGLTTATQRDSTCSAGGGLRAWLTCLIGTGEKVQLEAHQHALWSSCVRGHFVPARVLKGASVANMSYFCLRAESCRLNVGVPGVSRRSVTPWRPCRRGLRKKQHAAALRVAPASNRCWLSSRCSTLTRNLVFVYSRHFD